MRLLLSTAFFVTLLFLGTLARSAAVDDNAVAGVSERSGISDAIEPRARRPKFKNPLSGKGNKGSKKKDRKKNKKKKCRGQPGQPGDESDSDTEDCPTSTRPLARPTL
ncbi:hypothetical protein CH063_10353 [Colletotrichum higginsianum]|uniref:Uncharacterized protein n=2 Tax=Colletotrichum higginsianum TaxID=80884 RepID=H1VH42_COLHI|nr:hypothetical protein CH63R_03265 [Colletotrichum higginsianum IMI 349063]OBR14539.1 hypothetical protein CH63R_03265 [Colletotrichum higginsianum IMI 349063]TID01995.1 hypothetical protein CH35J_004648 [Colletotrichum higginsianum]GJC94793.1 hypothetical protein ColKHC_03619 [Colletotrichum higginsianum]CCF39545.1 hypothetical protein CH063_10353 [Colletotrichum higginsianum]